MTAQPDAFLSYTRTDDEFFGGAITSLRKLLELGVQVVTGQRSFRIFQDIDGIEFGRLWQQELDQAIAQARLFIPVVTPLFFGSEACRDELEKFIEHERRLGRNDLILPLYFVTAPVLEKADLLSADPLASALSKRQRYDWRSKKDLPINDPQVRGSVLNLAENVAAALSRAAATSEESRTRSRSDAPARASALAMVEQTIEDASDVVKRDEPERKQKQKPKNILWVDDRPDNNRFERRAMEKYNINFDLARSTEEALTQLRQVKYDAIISDMGRPPDAQAGYTLLKALRRIDRHTPFFIYAGSNEPKHLKLALSMGAQGSTNSAEVLISSVLRVFES